MSRAGSSSISVLIAVRDGERFLAEAIRSALEQDVPRVEIVVVDDGSTDGTAGVAEAFGDDVILVRQPPLGIGAARNHAVNASSGELLAFLDADDLFEPGRLQRQAAALERDPRLEAAFGRISEFVEPGLSEADRATLRSPREGVASHLVSAMLIRRSAFDRVGPFITDQPVNVTIEWYARALDAHLRSEMLDDVVLRRRLHGGNVGVRRWDDGRQLVSIARAALERRRSSGVRSSGGGAP